MLCIAPPRGRGLRRGGQSPLPEPPCFAHGKVLVGAAHNHFYCKVALAVRPGESERSEAAATRRTPVGGLTLAKPVKPTVRDKGKQSVFVPDKEFL